MKLLIMGPANVGKTSLLRATMENTSFMAIENLPPTRGVNREVYLFRGLLELSAWDAGGQKIYQNRHYGQNVDNVFGDVDLPIYMVDAVTVDGEIKVDFEKFATTVVEKNHGIKKIYVFINKIDLPDSRGSEVIELLLRDLAPNLKDKIDFASVSVKAGSAQSKLIAICDEAIDARLERMAKATKLRQVMEDFKKKASADFILFNRRDGLVITSTFGKFNTPALQFLTFQLCTLESNIHHVFEKVKERRGDKISPLALNTVVFESLTEFVLVKEVEDKATLMVLTKDKKSESITKVVDVISDAHPTYEQLVNVLQFDSN